MKEKKMIVMLVGILAILLCILYGLKAWNRYQEQKTEEEKESQKIFAFSTEELVKMQYEDSTGVSISFTKEDTWIYDEDSSILTDEEAMSQMEEAFSDIEAVKVIENPDALEDYGMDAPQFRIYLTEAEGEERSFLIGNTAGENYYFVEEGDDKIYLVASEISGEMLWEAADFAKEEIFPYVSEESFVKAVITKADGTEIIYETPEENAITSLAGMYFTDCADYHVTEETLVDYGLDEETRITAEVTYEDEGEEISLIFYIGNVNDTETYYYVQQQDSQQVHRVLKTTIDSLLGEEEE